MNLTNRQTMQSRIWVSSLLILILLLAGCAGLDQPVVITDPATTDGQVQSGAVDTTAQADETDLARSNMGMVDAENVLVTATSLTDYNFENIDGEVTGSIQDVLVDTNNGEVLYVTVEYGGFLDIGDTELPMPLGAFVWGDNGQLVLNFDESQLANFPDLETDWPNTEDAGWDDDVANFWNGIGFSNTRNFSEATDSVLYVDDLIGFNMSDLGAGANTIEDLLIDLGQSHVKYVVIEAVASVGVDEVIAVPFDALMASTSGNLLTFRDDIDSTIIADAPRFDRNELMAGNPQLYTGNNNYWNGLGYGYGVVPNADPMAQDETITSEEQGLTVTDGVGMTGGENTLVSASTLLDYNTTNVNGERIGEIEDLLVDVENGRILFAMLEYGGFLDIGDREVPIPLSALSWVSENELMLNLDEQQLENLPDLGTNWPDITDTNWNTDISTYWTDNGFDTSVSGTATQTVMYASDLMGYQLADNGMGATGSIDDLLIDLSQSQASWLIVDYGAFFNDTLIPIPFSAIDVSMLDNNLFNFTPKVDLTTFESAPRIDNVSLDEVTLIDSSFDDEIVTYWENAGYNMQVDQSLE